MSVVYENYVSASAHTLITKENPRTGTGPSGDISCVSISNNSANDATVHVYLDTGSTQYYFCKNTVIPSGAALVLKDNLSFDKNKYSFKVHNTGTSPDITVIIK